MRIAGMAPALVLCASLGMAQEDIYTIQEGDTLERIAEESLGKASLWLQLAKYNHLPNPDAIQSGQEIVIPGKAQLLVELRRRESRRRGTLVEDDFEGGTGKGKPEDWIFPSGGKWGVSALGSRVLEQSDRHAGNSAAITGEKGWFSYAVQAELRIERSGDAGVFAYWNSSLENYRLRTTDGRRKLQIAKRVPKGQGSQHTISLNETSFHLGDGRWYVFKLEVTTHDTHTYLRGKVWPKGETEPGTWLLEASDHTSGRYGSGRAGLWTTKSGSSYRGARFDNFSVSRNTGVY